MSDKPDMPTRARRAATLADVGREAGVSAMAASAVLNGPSTSTRISEETRRRVLEVAQKLRYRPNRTARGLVDRRMNTLGLVGILAGDEPNLYFLEVFDGLMQAARSRGQNVTVFNVSSWHDARQQLAEYCDGRIDGLILLAPMIEGPAAEWLPDHAPVVTIHANAALPGVPNLRADDEGGAFQAVSQLLRRGHRHILHVGGPEGSTGADLRLQGFRRAYLEAGVALPVDHVVRGPFTAQGGASGLEAWLTAHRGQVLPQAIFAGSDAVALGCLECLRSRGLQVPDDIAVVGFDNTLFARAAQLSTVAQPLGRLGRQAVASLLELIDAQQIRLAHAELQDTVLATELIERATLADPRSREVLIN